MSDSLERGGTHTGIRLRLSIPAGTIMDATSDILYDIATMNSPDICLPRCMPGCDQHGWFELIPGRVMRFTGAGDLKVEVKAVELPDEYPDD